MVSIGGNSSPGMVVLCAFRAARSCLVARRLYLSLTETRRQWPTGYSPGTGGCKFVNSYVCPLVCGMLMTRSTNTQKSKPPIRRRTNHIIYTQGSPIGLEAHEVRQNHSVSSLFVYHATPNKCAPTCSHAVYTNVTLDRYVEPASSSPSLPPNSSSSLRGRGHSTTLSQLQAV